MSSEENDNGEKTRQEYVDNGLLFFLFNKIDCMNQEDLLNVCVDFYSDEEVELAVTLMFCKYGCPEGQKDYRGAKKKENNIRQMMAFLCQKPAPKGVTFCISKCTQVPPITIDHVDMATVMKLFSSLRSEVRLLSSSNMRMNERITKIEKANLTISNEGCTNNQEVKGMSEKEVIDMQARLLKQFRPQVKGKKNTSFSDAVKNKPRQHSPSTVTPPGFKSQHNDSEVLSSSEETGEDEIEKTGAFQIQRWQKKKQKRNLKKEAVGTTHEDKSKSVTRKGIVIGTKESTGLLAAEPMKNVSLFVSRLQPSVLGEELKVHIVNISGSNKVVCEKLPAKHESYVSFNIAIGDLKKNKIPDLFQSENWPKGIVVKKWYEKKNFEKHDG